MREVRRLFLGALAGALILLLPASAAAAESAPMIDIGPPDDTTGEAYGINRHGVVVGHSEPSGMRWSAELGLEDLGPLLGGEQSWAYDINDAGAFVGTIGFGFYPNDTRNAYVWSEELGLELLPGLGDGYDIAFGINMSGQVVGFVGWTNSLPALWQSDHELVVLGTDGHTQGVAYEINDAGQIVGEAYNAFELNDSDALLWTADGGLTNLGSLGGGWSRAVGINEDGDVVGSAATANGTGHAFLWKATDGMTDLHALIGLVADGSYASDINNHGQVIGGYFDQAGNFWTYLWSPARGLVELEGVNVEALRVSDSGIVTGVQYFYEGEPIYRPVIWVVGITDELVDEGELSRLWGRRLDNKLASARDLYVKGNLRRACTVLRSYERQVHKLEEEQTVTTEVADTLLVSSSILATQYCP